MENRLRYLDSLVVDTKYKKKKSALGKDFEKYLSIYENRDLATALPVDVTRFLIIRDENGKTQVHEVTCPFLGSSGIFDCACPLRLAWGTVQCMIGQLRSTFDSIGRVGPWDGVRQTGNPIESNEVRNYLKAVKCEQARSHVLPKQAKPLFLDKLGSISLFIDNKLRDSSLLLPTRYILFRDQAFLTVLFFAGDRGHDLAHCLTQEIKKNCLIVVVLFSPIRSVRRLRVGISTNLH